MIFVEEGKYEDAIKEYEWNSLKEIDPSGAAYCYRNRATQYERLTEYDKAPIIIVLALEPETARYSNRAIFYENYKKDYQQALIDFSKAIELDKPERWY